MKKNHLVLLVLITLFFNSCSEQEKLFISPKLTAIIPKTKELTSREIKYTIRKDGNVTLPLRYARWVTAKLHRCAKNNKKLTIANKAMIEQINLVNRR